MLSPGEMSVGQIVTVIENKPFESDVASLFGDTAQKIVTQDRGGYGDILRIQAIDLPYIICLYLNKDYCGGGFKVTFDTRRTTFKELKREFAAELVLPKYKMLLDIKVTNQ